MADDRLAKLISYPIEDVPEATKEAIEKSEWHGRLFQLTLRHELRGFHEQLARQSQPSPSP